MWLYKVAIQYRDPAVERDWEKALRAWSEKRDSRLGPPGAPAKPDSTRHAAVFVAVHPGEPVDRVAKAAALALEFRIGGTPEESAKFYPVVTSVVLEDWSVVVES